MSSKEREPWSVFDRVKPFPSPAPSPDALMADIEAAIAATEHANSSAFLRPIAGDLPSLDSATAAESASLPPAVADGAYKSACAALAAGKPDSALRSLHVALGNCPPEKKSAVSRLRSLFGYALSEQQRLVQQPKSS